MEDANKPSLWSSGFTFVLAVSIVNATAFGSVNPLMPGFFISIGATLTVTGIVTGMFSYIALVGRFASILGDKRNKKHMLIIFLVVHGFFTLLYAFAPSIGWIIPLRIVRGLAFSISGTLIMSLGADYIPKERMGEGVGFLGIGMVLGMALGPNIGLAILSFFENNYPPLFIISGATIMFMGFVVILLRYKPAQQPVAEMSKFRFGDLIAVQLLPVAFITSAFAIGIGTTVSFLILMSNERGIANVGLYFLINSFVILLVRPMAGRLTDQKGVRFVVMPGFVFAACAMVVLGMVAATWHLIIAAVLAAFGSGIALPALQTECIQRLGPAKRTVAIGTYLIGMDIGMGGGPVLGGAIADATGFGMSFFFAAALAVLGFIAFFFYSARGKPEVYSQNE